tara:strand:+ start:14 stop:172 length:159 start_codon:yes stop_codon:yes gene_type:complete
MLGGNMKKKGREGYTEYSLDSGVKFLAKNEKDAELYRKKVEERISNLKNKVK